MKKKFPKYRTPARKQFIESSLKPLKSHTFLCRDFFVFDVKKDLRENARPELTNYIDSIDEYDTIVLAYPNYWGTFPMAVATFLERYDFTGKTVLPLCTNEGSGMGSSERDVKMYAKGADVKNGLAITGSQAANAKTAVEKWFFANGLM